MNRTPSPESIRDLERFAQHLPMKADQTLIILKGHLLTEELLREFIDSKLKNPKAMLAANRLEFDQCIALANAIAGDHEAIWIWQALKRLNGIRNKLAHNLEPQGIEDKIHSFIDFIDQKLPTMVSQDRVAQTMSEVAWAITRTYIALSVALRFKPTGLLESILEQPNHSIQPTEPLRGPATDIER